MARTKPEAGTSLVNIDAQLAAEAEALKQQISASSGNRLRIEARGAFATPDDIDLGDTIQFVVVDFASRNQYYTVTFDPNTPAAPDCYAMGRVLNEMVPEDDSPTKQHTDCATCPMNQFGSAANGRGKACSNRRLLAVLLIDPDNPDAHSAPDAPIYLLDLSPSNIKAFDQMAAYVQRSLGGPPIKAILTATARNKGTYAEVTFSLPEPNPDYAEHIKRRPECEDLLFRRPDFARAAAAAAQSKPARGRAAPARGRR